jgi:hypothetical protein
MMAFGAFTWWFHDITKEKRARDGDVMSHQQTVKLKINKNNNNNNNNNKKQKKVFLILSHALF